MVRIVIKRHDDAVRTLVGAVITGCRGLHAILAVATLTSDDPAAPDLTADGDWRENKFFRRKPSSETLAWVAASMGEGSRIVGHRRLTGGVNSAVHRLSVDRHGTRTFVVLRQYPAGSVALRTTMQEEIANLTVVAGSGLPGPDDSGDGRGWRSYRRCAIAADDTSAWSCSPHPNRTSAVDREDCRVCRPAART